MDINSQIEEKAIEWYIEHRNIYKKLALKVENIIKEILDLNGASYHMVCSRTKEIDSFKKKIAKEKYDDPINQITDLAGIRIITYVEDELTEICKIIEKIFSIDKDKSSDKSKELGIDKVGYKSVHYIAKLKEDRLILPEYSIFKDMVVEVQVRTILQHAWAEIEHDRNYKFSGKLPYEIQRRFKLLAGSLEISDREFNNISKEIDRVSEEIERGTKKGHLKFPINSTSLNQYIETKFEKLKKAGFEITHLTDPKVLEEIDRYGLKTLEDLDKIIPKDFINHLIEDDTRPEKKIAIIAIIRIILIINDYDKYFLQSWNNAWNIWSSKSYLEQLFDHYEVDWDQIMKKYNVSFKGVD
jgi:putative GTP pyrophosphokinase